MALYTSYQPLNLENSTWHLKERKENSLSQGKQTLQWLISVYQTSCPLDISLFCVCMMHGHLWLFNSNLWVLHQPQNAPVSCSIKNQGNCS